MSGGRIKTQRATKSEGGEVGVSCARSLTPETLSLHVPDRSTRPRISTSEASTTRLSLTGLPRRFTPSKSNTDNHIPWKFTPRPRRPMENPFSEFSKVPDGVGNIGFGLANGGLPRPGRFWT